MDTELLPVNLFCSKCKENKHPDEFLKLPEGRKRGYSGRCVDCIVRMCRKCNEYKTARNFWKLSTSPIGMRTVCRPCGQKTRRAWRNANKDVVNEKKRALWANDLASSREYSRSRSAYAREWKLKSFYGMTAEDYQRMHDKQAGKCAICGRTENNGRNFSVDHCHRTNKVRGLLCNRCNRAIGMFADNIEHMKAALFYLESHGGNDAAF